MRHDNPVLAAILNIPRLDSRTQLKRTQPVNRIGSAQAGEIVQFDLSPSRNMARRVHYSLSEPARVLTTNSYEGAGVRRRCGQPQPARPAALAGAQVTSSHRASSQRKRSLSGVGPRPPLPDAGSSEQAAGAMLGLRRAPPRPTRSRSRKMWRSDSPRFCENYADGSSATGLRQQPRAPDPDGHSCGGGWASATSPAFRGGCFIKVCPGGGRRFRA